MAEKSAIRFRAETEYTKARERKANTNLPIMAVVGNHAAGVAAVANRPGWYHIRLINERDRVTQCKSEGVALSLNDYIYVVKARDRNLTYYEFHSFIQTGGGMPHPPVCPRWEQVFTVSVNSCQYRLVSQAVTDINTLIAAGITPTAASPWLIQVMAGDFDEATAAAPANVTLPQYVHLKGRGESTVLDMSTFALVLSADTSVETAVVESTGDWQGCVVHVTGNDAKMGDVHVRCTGSNVGMVLESVTGFRGYHIYCEATVGGATSAFYFYDSDGLLWDCDVDDSGNWDWGLYLDDAADPSDGITKFCQFANCGTGDVYVESVCRWFHFCCNFDPNSITMNGTEHPLPHGKTNFDDIVYLENGVTMDGASGGNDIVIPDNQAIAFAIEDDGAVAPANLEYMRIISTNAAQEMIFNFDEADVNFRICANAGSDPTDAFFVEGSTGHVYIGDDVPPLTAHLSVEDSTLTMASGYAGISSWHTKTAGDSNEGHDFFGVYSQAQMNQNAAVVGNVYGVYGWALLMDGTIGDGDEDLCGGYFLAQEVAGEVTQNVYGVYARAALDGGTVSGDVMGVQSIVATLAAMTSIAGDIYGIHIDVDDDEGAAGTVYMLYMNEQDGIDYGIYQSGTARHYLQGTTAIGGTDSTAAQLYVDQSAVGGTIPVLLLDQADLSEEFIEFTTTVGAGNPIDATTALGGYYGMARVSVTGVGMKWIALYN